VREPEMVQIPAGRFSIGSASGTVVNANETPVCAWELPSYAIGRYPVTNYQYLAFVQDTGTTPPRYWEHSTYPEELRDHPVVYVTWTEALAYCRWLAGKTGKPYRLPTEAEWERAAKGNSNKIWPWGNDWIADRCNAEGKFNRTTPVGHFSPAGDSPEGVADLAGNVWEWCSSLYRPYPYSDKDERENPATIGERTLRGGSFLVGKNQVRCTCRHKHLSTSLDRDIGFRVALSLSS
jgi:formylglycine-generating enzyme required for sulfatase activity